MLKRRFIPYMVGAGIVALISLSFVGYRAYQNHVEFKAFMSKAQAFNRSVELEETDEHLHAEEGHPHGEKNIHPFSTAKSSSNSFVFKGKQGDEYVYEINGIPVYSKGTLDKELSGGIVWAFTGRLNPEAEDYLKNHLDSKRAAIVQRVVTPDGKLHHVVVPSFSMYEDGDAILESETRRGREVFNGPSLEDPVWRTLSIAGVQHPVPDEYYDIEDQYARELYIEKFRLSVKTGISMEEVDRKIADGEISLDKLSDSARRFIESSNEHQEKVLERLRMIAPEIPPLSDKPPVKVSFLRDEGKDARPGWKRKRRLPKEPQQAAEGGNSLDTDTVSEGGLPVDTQGTPLSESDLPDMTTPTPSAPTVADLEKQLTPEGIEAELSEGLSTDRFDKAQDLIDQFGTEEGLRRLRETDPEAARQFERERSPKPPRDVPNDEQP